MSDRTSRRPTRLCTQHTVSYKEPIGSGDDDSDDSDDSDADDDDSDVEEESSDEEEYENPDENSDDEEDEGEDLMSGGWSEEESDDPTSEDGTDDDERDEMRRKSRKEIEEKVHDIMNEIPKSKILNSLLKWNSLLPNLACGDDAKGLTLDEVVEELESNSEFTEWRRACDTSGVQELGRLTMVGYQCRLTLLSTKLSHLLAILLMDRAYTVSAATALVTASASTAESSAAASAAASTPACCNNEKLPEKENRVQTVRLVATKSAKELAFLLGIDDTAAGYGDLEKKKKMLSVIKRLLLRIHPDKNLEMKEQANAATKVGNELLTYIQEGKPLPAAESSAAARTVRRANIDSLVRKLLAKIGAAGKDDCANVLRMAYAALCALDARNPVRKETQTRPMDAGNKLLRTFQGSPPRPTREQDLNMRDNRFEDIDRRRVLMQFKVRCNDEKVLEQLQEGGGHFPHNYLIHWGSEVPVYVGSATMDAMRATAFRLVRYVREVLTDPNARMLWSRIGNDHAAAFPPACWTTMVVKGRDVDVPSKWIALGDEFALPLSLFADEKLDDDSRRAHEVDVAILKLMVAAHHDFFSNKNHRMRPWCVTLVLNSVRDKDEMPAEWSGKRKLSMEDFEDIFRCLQQNSPIGVAFKNHMIGSMSMTHVSDSLTKTGTRLFFGEFSPLGSMKEDSALQLRDGTAFDSLTTQGQLGQRRPVLRRDVIIDGLMKLPPSKFVLLATTKSSRVHWRFFFKAECLAGKGVLEATLKPQRAPVTADDAYTAICNVWANQSLIYRSNEKEKKVGTTLHMDVNGTWSLQRPDRPCLSARLDQTCDDDGTGTSSATVLVFHPASVESCRRSHGSHGRRIFAATQVQISNIDEGGVEERAYPNGLKDVRGNGLLAIIPITGKEAEWPMDMMLDGDLTLRNKQTITDWRRDWDETEHGALADHDLVTTGLIQYYVACLNKDIELKQSFTPQNRYYSNSVYCSRLSEVDRKLDEEVRTWCAAQSQDLSSIVSQVALRVNAFPPLVRDLFRAKVTNMTSNCYDSNWWNRPFLPPSYEPAKKRMLQEAKNVPALAKKEAEEMFLDAAANSPPKIASGDDLSWEVNNLYVTPALRELWVQTATRNDLLYLGMERCGPAMLTNICSRISHNPDRVTGNYLVTKHGLRPKDNQELVKIADTLEERLVEAKGLRYDGPMSRDATLLIQRYHDVRAMIARMRQKGKVVAQMIRPLAEALRALDDNNHYRMAHTFTLASEGGEGGVVNATDPFDLRFMSKFEIDITALLREENAELNTANHTLLFHRPLVSFVVIEMLSPIIKPLDGMLYFLDHEPPEDWEKLSCPTQQQIYIFNDGRAQGCGIGILSYSGTKGHIFLVLKKPSGPDAFNRSTVQTQCKNMPNWFASKRAPGSVSDPKSKSKRRKEGKQPSSSPGSSSHAGTSGTTPMDMD